MKKRKILAFTSNRSEYDLMSYLYKRLAADRGLDFRVLVSGAHLSPTFGETVRTVERDGLRVLDRIETLLDSDADAGRIKSASILLQNAIQSVTRFAPDLILYAGDREDVIIAALIGGYLRIPTAHFFAGDQDLDGLIDNPVRHAASRLSTFKFVSLEEHRRRLLALGENPARIFLTGSPALDKFREERRLSRAALFRRIAPGRPALPRHALVLFHPLMGQEDKSLRELRACLETLKSEGIPAVVNTPNIDAGARRMLALMKEFSGHEGFRFVNGLDRECFVNVYRGALFQLGNSSSGILEAASIPLAAINVGDRNAGRAHQRNVIFSRGDAASLRRSIARALSPAFQRANVRGLRNQYGDGRSSEKAYRILKRLRLEGFEEFRREDPLRVARSSR